MKMKERYGVGWSETRGLFGAMQPREPDVISIKPHRPTTFSEIPTDTLRGLWLAKFGEYAVNVKDLNRLAGEDICEVGQELANRNLIVFEKILSISDIEPSFYYVLLREKHGNN
jgi:hypothetical protein